MRGKFDTAKLSQSACLLEGLCINLHRTDGDFAVVIHSYKDCANVFPRGMTGEGQPRPGRFFCTNITESDVMAGRTLERLEECVEVVAEEKRPEIIYVFASCVSELIGDDIAGCIEGLRGRVGVPVVAVTSSGLDDVSQRRIIDWHADLMYMACAGDSEVEPLSVNLLGYPRDAGGEIAAALGDAGIKVNAWLHGASGLPDWKKLPRGALNVAIEESLFSTLLGKMEKERGTPRVVAPLPVGVANTDGFYGVIGDALGLGKELAAAVAERRKKAVAGERALVKKCRGKRAGYNIGTDRNYEPYTVAMDGLCEAQFFIEAGFALTLLIQGSPDAGRKKHIDEHLKRMGLNASYEIFVDNVSLGPALAKSRYDLVYCVKFLSEIVRPSDTPMIDIGSLRMGYGGFLYNAELVEKTMALGRT